MSPNLPDISPSLGIKDGSGSDVAVARALLGLVNFPSARRSPHLISGKLFPEAAKVLLSSSPPSPRFSDLWRDGCVEALPPPPLHTSAVYRVPQKELYEVA